MQQGDQPQPPDWRPIQRTTLVPTVDAKGALKSKASSGRNTMIVGGVVCALGVLFTLLSGFQTLFWGAILFGGIAFFSGMAQYAKANSDLSKSSGQQR